MKKNILGLDLGTNSIGWALIEQNLENGTGKIHGMGSRIIPMAQDKLNEFGKGNSVSQTAERTNYRSIRRLRERHLLRRERLHRVLHILDFLPSHYDKEIDFEKRLGKFKENKEPKIAYKPIWNEEKNKYVYEFIFKDSFQLMLAEFKQRNPSLFDENNSKEILVPYDWTLYYLRKKALTAKISKEELAWLLLNFNQKRGYYQLRGEEEEDNPSKNEEFHTLKIVKVSSDEIPNAKKEIWYSLTLENGWIYRRASKTPLYSWEGSVRDFIVTTDLNEDGSVKKNKEGEDKRSFRAPAPDDWTLQKKKTENEIEKSSKTLGAYIYDILLSNPKQKINGGLVSTIERKIYKNELNLILEKQKEFHPELSNPDNFIDCVRELYRNNEGHQMLLAQKDFTHLFIEDILFYQRPLKSQKSSISNCTLEYRWFKDKQSTWRKQNLKAIPKSNPYYQEFRLWQWISNLSIYSIEDDKNITAALIIDYRAKEKLYDFLYNRKEVDQKAILKHFKLNEKTHYWNYVKDKKYPCNETGTQIRTRLEKVEGIASNFLTKEIEHALWHLIYSVTDKIDYEKALKSFANKYSLNVNSFFEAFKKFPPFKSEYGSFSEKAIKKLLTLMRVGTYWHENHIDKKTEIRIDKIITGEYDENILDRVRDKAMLLTHKEHFQGLPLWLAQYIVFDRHSEAADMQKWESVSDLETFLSEFKQHSLRNPIVEQVITETLRVAKDIWIYYGKGEKNFFQAIHVELGRDMKNTADERERLTKTMTENENTNQRIKALLVEMQQDSNVENVRAYSPSQQEILKIYEDGVLNSSIEIEDEILKISKTAQPSPTDLKRYKLWLEQKYRSPYTGEIISLNKLFTNHYEIEHIIPQSRYFDDGFSNKVICEAAVNKLKDNYIGLAFIKEFHGQKVECGFGKTVKILEVDAYEDFIKSNYANNRSKRNKLLLEEVPEKMIERQLNDTRYISKYVSGLLSNIVRAEANDDGVNSKNLIPGNGKITTALKQDWGLNDVWNDIILPRFERLNQLHNTTVYTTWNENYQKYLPTVPLEQAKGFSKKRIDHRHHAMDALIIACATREHVNYMNNEHATRKGKSIEEKQGIRYELRNKLCIKKYNDDSEKNYKWIFKKPWENFTTDAKQMLESIVVSFKQNTRVINKSNNKTMQWIEKDGKKMKQLVEQQGTNWAVRKPLHKDTVSGKVNLPRIKVPKDKILTATRKRLDTSFDIKTIDAITDTGIQKILKQYLAAKGGSPEIAFTPEGIEEMNENIIKYNDGKAHQPIQKVRIFELGSKFSLGVTGNKLSKYVEAAKGTNLFFGIYVDEKGKRSFETIPLNIVLERQKQGLSPVPEVSEKGAKLLFHLSPNDLVYIPEDIEQNFNNKLITLTKEQISRIYKMVSSTGSECHFVPVSYSSPIIPNEIGTNNKNERATQYFKHTDLIEVDTKGIEKPIMIKMTCIKVIQSRIGIM